MFYHGIKNKLLAEVISYAEKVDSPQLSTFDEAYDFVTRFFLEMDRLPCEIYHDKEEFIRQQKELADEGFYSKQQIKEMIKSAAHIPALCMAGVSGEVTRELTEEITRTRKDLVSPLRQKLLDDAYGKIHYSGLAIAGWLLALKARELTSVALIVTTVAHERQHSIQPREIFNDLLKSRGQGRGAVMNEDFNIVSIDENEYYRRKEENDAERAAVKQLIQFVRHMREQIV